MASHSADDCRDNGPRLIVRVRRNSVNLTVACCLVLVVGVASVAGAASWGPRTSSYNGSIVVEGHGSLTRLDGGSRSYSWAKDRKVDGNTVYAYTDWDRMNELCTGFTVGVLTLTSCSATSTQVLHLSSPEVGATSTATYPTTSLYHTRDWCDSNGNSCATYGLKAEAGACAQMGWPVPDSCTYAYVEFHRP